MKINKYTALTALVFGGSLLGCNSYDHSNECSTKISELREEFKHECQNMTYENWSNGSLDRIVQLRGQICNTPERWVCKPKNPSNLMNTDFYAEFRSE